MKLFQICQKYLPILGIVSNQSRFNRNSVRTSLLYGLSTLLSIVFLVFKATTFIEYTINIYITSAITLATTTFALVLSKKESLFKLINDMGNIFDKKTGNLPSERRYSVTSQQIEKWCKIGYLVIAKATPVCFIFPRSIYSYFSYFATTSGNAAFEIPLLFWFPFNWKSPFGYLVVIIFEYVACAHFFLFIASVICIAIGDFICVVSVIDDLRNDLKSINKIAKTKTHNIETLKSLREFTEIYSMLKQFLHDALKIYRPVFVILSTWSLVFICGVMLLIQMELQEPDWILFFVICFYATYAFCLEGIFCELGQRTTDAFEEVSNEISAFEWHSFSTEVQKLLPTILIGTQRPVEIEFFGSISGTRDTFKKIIKSSISYFLVIREFISK